MYRTDDFVPIGLLKTPHMSRFSWRIALSMEYKTKMYAYPLDRETNSL